MEQKAYLILENGTVFEGKSFGASGESIGEVVFTTAMTGYLETLTDPSYYGQIVIQTFPLIGNYGVISPDFESAKPFVKAYIVREWCQEPSNFRCEGNLDTFLKQQNIVGLYGIDTRALTRIVRESGVMNALITTDLDAGKARLDEIKNYSVKHAVEAVSCKEEKTFSPETVKYKVALWDFGAKDNIKRELLKRDCEVTMIPSTATAQQIIAKKPDGIMLSNGPGDPAENKQIIEELKELVQAGIPIFGICLGHQLMALSQGAKTRKMKYGHRGANQPVLEVETGRVFISSQNHGYAVCTETLPETAKASFVNANDQSCEGVTYSNIPVYTVQYHPEASGGPLDTNFLFDKFIQMMEEGKHNAAK